MVYSVWLLLLQNGLCHQTTVLLQEISQFARMIKTKSDKSKPITTSIPRLKDMKIDVYLSTGHLPAGSDTTTKPVEKPYGQHVEQAPPVQSNKDSDRKIVALKGDITKYLEEKKKLQDENKINNKKIEELILNVKTLEDKNQKLLKEKAELENKVKMLEQESVQIAPGMFCCLIMLIYDKPVSVQNPTDYLNM